VPPEADRAKRTVTQFIYINMINNLEWLPEQDSNLRPFD